jgi:Putative 2OG-Fe(II) oxygenase
LQRISLVLHFARVRKDWQPLLAFCDETLEKNTGHTSARYHRALALIQLNRGEEAVALLDPSNFLSFTPIELRPGQVLGEFTDALQKEILANPTLMSDPRTKATQHGLQTQQLLQPDQVAVPALLQLIRNAVDRYTEKLDGMESADEFITCRPKRARIASWAVVYPGAGCQRSHFHPNGWLSGVFYVAAPSGGHLLLGAFDSKEVEHAPWKIEHLQPEPGFLALFPSFIPHATEPTHSEDLRICIAFDVLPA